MTLRLGTLPRLWAIRGGICLLLANSTLQAQTQQQVQQHIASDIESGFNIMLNRQEGNCLTCHTLSDWRNQTQRHKELGQQGNFGPVLDGVGTRYNKTELLQWVTDARKIKPDTLMPPYGSLDGLNQPNASRPLLTLEQRQAVAAALSTLR